MKRYRIDGAVMITYLRPATDDDKSREGPVRTDAVLVRDAIVNYEFTQSDILPDEYMTLKLPDGTINKIPADGYCYTVYDAKRPMGWFWVVKSAVKEIE